MRQKSKKAFQASPRSASSSAEVPLQKHKPTSLAYASWLTDIRAQILIAVIGILAYASGLGSPFWNDDLTQIVSNTAIHSLANIGLFFSEGTFTFPSGHLILIGGFYRPLMTTVFSLIYMFFGLHAYAYHGLQLLLGIGSAILLFRVFRYSFGAILSFMLALIFLVHPIDSQVLFAIPSMQDALYFFFGVLALWILLAYGSRRSMLAACLLLFASMLSKETGVLFVVVCLLYLWLFDPLRLKFFATWVSIPVITYWLLYLHASPFVKSPRGSAPINELGLVGRLLTAPSTMAFYLSKLVWPKNLATAYYWIVTKPTLGGFWVPVAIDVAFVSATIFAGLLLFRRTSKAVFKTYVFYMVWIFTGLGLVSQIVPLDMVACETWFYFSMAGLMGLIGVVISDLVPISWKQYQTIAVACVVAVIMVLGVRTALRGLDWENTTRLDYIDVANSPGDFGANDRLSQALALQGKFRPAVAYEQRSIELFPAYYNYENMALTMVKMGNYSGAIGMYKKSLALNYLKPTIDSAAGLATVYDNPEDAYSLINGGLSYYSGDYSLWMDMAIISSKMHHYGDVEAALTQASRMQPVDQNLAEKLLSGQPFEAKYNGKLMQFN